MQGSFAAAEPGHSSGLRQSSGTAKSNARPPIQPFLIPITIVFYVCTLSHVVAASVSPTADCDETFNYWEPLHYLTHGHGLQTWEYSPEFSIRSWAYILLHAVPTKVLSFFGKDKTYAFFILRCVLAGLCGASETRLYSAISRTLHPRIAVFYLLIVAFTPGFFSASVAFLPSSFAMYTTTMGIATFLDWRQGAKTGMTITWFGIGALLGWPFAGALIIPFVLEDWTIALLGGGVIATLRQYIDGIVHCLIVLGLQVACDSYFYREWVIIPWRIVAYNVFGGKDRGPDIFGTEPWHFYVRNLLLNFNLWFLLAFTAAPLLLLQACFRSKSSTRQTLLRTITLISPFYLWLAIFTLQPHKEERFMFPAYPFLALNAAIALHMLLTWISISDPSTLIGKIPPQLKTALILPVITLSLLAGILRTAATVTNYNAPLKIYDPLAQHLTTTHPNATTICFGKDWYRFPSSYFLPDPLRAKFIKSEFDGLLPGSFYEGSHAAGYFPGTFLVPPGMNDLNREDPGKYVDVDQCSFLVDSSFPSTKPTRLEPDFVGSEGEGQWERVKCVPFLDAASTGIVARTVWVPDWPVVPARFRRVWGEHCLLRRRV